MITEAGRMKNPSDTFLKVFTVVGILFDFPDLSWSEIRKRISQHNFLENLMTF